MIDSLSHFQSEKKRAIWLQIPESLSQMVPIAVSQGFSFHHVKEKQLMLTKCLSVCNIPHYASHYIGAGGLVYDKNTNKILLIQDKHSIKKGIWKFPGGLVEPSESIHSAVLREVKEETGIDCSFSKMLCFRETMNYQFGCPDIYFVCLVEPTSFELKIQESEVLKAQWFSIGEID